MPLYVGLTGGIGSGKSTVASLFENLGAGIIDTDEIAHNLTRAKGNAVPEIRRVFGNEFINNEGAMIRKKMRELIFADASAKRLLEQLLHPMILDRAKSQSVQLATRPYIIFVVPLLAQSAAFRQLVQRVLVVDCDEGNQIARVTARSHMNADEVRAIIAQQTPRSELLDMADDVIRNSADPADLFAQVDALHRRYLNNN
ncbi:MAG: dephospho-CoA kinase [Gallionella sp.]